MHLFQRQIFGTKLGVAPNTFIGGIGAVINTPTLLAAKLGVLVSQISNFSVIGSDIQCRITGSYGSTGTWFQGLTATNNNPGITYFIDSDGLVTSLKSYAFYANQQQMLVKKIEFNNCATIGDYCFAGSGTNSNIEEIILPNCVSSTGTNQFTGLSLLKKVYIPRMTNLGTSSGDNGVFNGVPTGVKIYAHSSLATNNSGAPDGDLAYAISRGCAVAYVTNFTLPNPVTDLSVGTIYNRAIQLNFTPPTGSTNAIDYYECYANGVYKNKITASGQYITELSASTNYNLTIVAIDVFYNKSVVSNVVNVSTNTTVYYQQESIVSYYKMESNVVDSVSSNHGTAAAITYSSGLVGQAAVFNGTTSRVITTNNSNLQLSIGSISCVLKSSASGSTYRGLVVKQNAYSLFLKDGVLMFYNWGTATGITSGDKSTGVNLNDGLNHTVVLTFQMGVVNGTKIYLDGNLVLTTSVALLDQTKALVIGAGNPDAISQQINAQIDEVAIFNTVLSSTSVSEINSKLNTGQNLI